MEGFERPVQRASRVSSAGILTSRLSSECFGHEIGVKNGCSSIKSSVYTHAIAYEGYLVTLSVW